VKVEGIAEKVQMNAGIRESDSKPVVVEDGLNDKGV